MRLHMRELVAGIGGERRRRADLIGDEPLDLGGRKGQPPPAEAPKVRKAGMGTDGHAFVLGDTKGAGHDLRVAAMKAAGDIGRGDDVEHGRIIAHDIGAETFAAVAIEIDARHEIGAPLERS